jgi:neutral ceramidase
MEPAPARRLRACSLAERGRELVGRVPPAARLLLAILACLACAPAKAQTSPATAQPNSPERLWRVGVARANITPTNALWMAGYAGRTHPADGKATDLWLKALALEDGHGRRAVVVTADLLAIRGSLYRHCLPRLKEKFGLEPAQVLLTASHTHCGPMLPNRPGSLSALDETDRRSVEQYCSQLADRIVETTGRALADLAPARLVCGQGTTGFAANRRNNREAERARLAEEGALAGPVEHSVPVLAAYHPDGKLRAVLFGYACHNTTWTHEYYKWCGDYAGFAQAALEQSHPGATALFFVGCAGDQDPVVRGSLGLAQRYGNMLAGAVEEALRAPSAPLAPTLKTTMEMVTLNLGPAPTEAELEKLQRDPTSYVRRWATNLLADLKSGRPLERTWPYPVQAWQFGGQQLLITLGGEPVVDYAIKFKREFGPHTWVAGYGNDVMCYIPSLRVLNEDKPPRASPLWGYEGCQAMKVLGLPALRWADDVEDLVTASARRLVNKVNGSESDR